MTTQQKLQDCVSFIIDEAHKGKGYVETRHACYRRYGVVTGYDAFNLFEALIKNKKHV